MSSFTVIPSIDLLDGKVVRLLRGEFDSAKTYGDPSGIIERWQIPMGTPVHVVDLEASRRGKPTEIRAISRLAQLGYPTQIGGGVRSVEDAKLWIDAGASTLVLGTIAAEDPDMLESIVNAVGVERVLPAVDMTEGVVRVSGWESSSSRSAPMIFEHLESIGIPSVMITDISRDGTMQGPDFQLYRDIRELTSLRVIASGGVGTLGDVTSLARNPSLDGVIVGKAIHERSFTWSEAHARAQTARSLPARVVPVMEISGGRVAEPFRNPATRDPGDPLELAARWEADDADEILLVDHEELNPAFVEAVRHVAQNSEVPVTAGGCVRSLADIRTLLGAGAARVLVTGRDLQPEVLAAGIVDLGFGEIVAQIDVQLGADGTRLVGEFTGETRPSDWAARLEAMGVGEILLAVHSDNGSLVVDVPTIRRIAARVRIDVTVLVEGATTQDLVEAIESGGARALAIRGPIRGNEVRLLALKHGLTRSGIPTRARGRTVV